MAYWAVNGRINFASNVTYLSYSESFATFLLSRHAGFRCPECLEISHNSYFCIRIIEQLALEVIVLWMSTDNIFLCTVWRGSLVCNILKQMDYRSSTM
jgi:hypothetical protein